MVFRALNLFFAVILAGIMFPIPSSFAEEIEIEGRKIDTKSIAPDPEMLKNAKEAVPKDMDKKVQEEVDKLTGKGGIFSGAKEIEERQKKELLKGRTNESKDSGAIQEKGILAEDERVYVFISSSVPVETLRNYTAAVDALHERNVVMVIRGFVDGVKKIGPTLDFVKKIIFKDKSCDIKKGKCETYKANIMIEPRLFRQYGIDKAPAIVYARGAVINNLEMTPRDDSFYVVYGDISLDGAMEIIDKEARTESLPRLVKKIRGGFYAN
ncbi:MAG: hypothetical protein HY265_03965 [Deltaproteobacteria bacterium]|nr:hypothetical protein [Deltaproteobacteria bacterium]